MKKYVVWLLAFLALAVLCGISFAAQERCPNCGGSGKVNCHECNGLGRCTFCGGDGKLSYVPSYGTGKGEYPTCSVCNGSGTCSNCNGNRKEQCSRCSGSGYIYTGDGGNGSTGNNDNTNTGDQSLAPSINPSIDTNLTAKIGEGYIANNAYRGNIFQYAEAENGTPQFKWTISKGTFPSGLGIFPGDHGESMVLDTHNDRFLHFDGIPTTAGTYNFTLKVTDAQGRSAEKDYTMTVEGDDFDSRLTIVSKVENDTLRSPEYVIGEYSGVNYYEFNYHELFGEVSPAPRAPYTWTLVAGNIPNGMRLEYANGNKEAYLAGRPSGKGSFSFLMKVTDSDGRSARKTFFVSVDGDQDDTTANGHRTLTDDTDPEISGSFPNGQEGQVQLISQQAEELLRIHGALLRLTACANSCSSRIRDCRSVLRTVNQPLEQALQADMLT